MDSMQPTQALNDAEQFFFDHAGYSHDPLTETPEQGRTRSARSLAHAEELYLKAHQVADVRCMWEEDPDGIADYRADKAAGRLRGDLAEPSRIEGCTLVDRNDEPLASLWSIWDADEDYRRVVRAELADECASRLRQIIEEAKG